MTQPTATPAATHEAPPGGAAVSDADRDLQACLALMRTGSRSFFAAARLLPARVRPDAVALYAFCRVADDLVDDPPHSVDDSLALLGRRLDAVYAGRPGDAVEDRALAAVVQRHRLPRPLLDALLDGFAWDARGRQYETVDDLHGYGARVAGSVGAMMCWIMGARSPVALARACEMGVAMQLTNIARDVGDDARLGRLYLPRQWLREAGLDPEAWLAAPACTPPLQRVVERLLVEAERLYAQATGGVACLPRDCQAAILAARLIYADIGAQLRRDGLDPVSRRAVVPAARKLVLLTQAWWLAGRTRAPEARHAPAPLPAIRYLIDHCDDASAAAVVPALARPVRERVVWMIELFERLEQQRLSERLNGRGAR
jgi:phytoene synthase